MSAVRFVDKRILIVMKSTKYDRVKASGKSVSPYIQNVLMDSWREATQMHYDISMACHEHLLKLGAKA